MQTSFSLLFVAAVPVAHSEKKGRIKVGKLMDSGLFLSPCPHFYTLLTV